MYLVNIHLLTSLLDTPSLLVADAPVPVPRRLPCQCHYWAEKELDLSNSDLNDCLFSLMDSVEGAYIVQMGYSQYLYTCKVVNLLKWSVSSYHVINWQLIVMGSILFFIIIKASS